MDLPIPSEEDLARVARLAATLDQMSIALERIATQLERINAPNVVDPAKVEALRSQLDAAGTSLQASIDNAAKP